MAGHNKWSKAKHIKGALDDYDDCQIVYLNFDIADEIMESVEL